MANIDVLIGGLRRMQNGANVHTINKAVSYLRAFSTPGSWFCTEEKRLANLKFHVGNCERAIETGRVEALRILMRRWF